MQSVERALTYNRKTSENFNHSLFHSVCFVLFCIGIMFLAQGDAIHFNFFALSTFKGHAAFSYFNMILI